MAESTMEQHALSVGSVFVWHELNVPDSDAGAAFYVNALGFGSDVMEMGDMRYTMLTMNGKAVAGIMSTNSPEMPPGVPPHWATYIAVDDVDARLAKCVELGATVVVPAMDVPTIGRMALIADPQGAHVWIYRDASA